MSGDGVAYHNGHWVPRSQLAIPIDDLGFVQGVTAVERLRTWSGEIPLLDAHLRRLEWSTSVLRIEGLPRRAVLAELVAEVLRRNPSEQDAGVTILATPGRRGAGRPTLCVLSARLDHDRIHHLQRAGQPLVITSVAQPSPDCWPRDIKVRCRIHYYLADRIAIETLPEALAVLIDQDGSITETSTSNILLATDQGLVLPPEDRVLPGVMAATLCQLAARQEIPVIRRRIDPDELRTSPHVWLTGSETGLWPASHVDGIAKIIDGRIRQWQQKLIAYLCEEAEK